MEEKVVEFIKQYIDDGIEITMDSDFFNDLGLSSLDMITLIFSIEEKFGMKINIMELVGVKTVGELINKINIDHTA